VPQPRARIKISWLEEPAWGSANHWESSIKTDFGRHRRVAAATTLNCSGLATVVRTSDTA